MVVVVWVVVVEIVVVVVVVVIVAAVAMFDVFPRSNYANAGLGFAGNWRPTGRLSLTDRSDLDTVSAGLPCKGNTRPVSNVKSLSLSTGPHR